MNDYILVVSTEKPNPWSANLSDSQRTSQEHIAALKRLSTGLSTLHRESLPDNPYSLDVAKCLASISSAVIRSTGKSAGTVEGIKAKIPAADSQDRFALFAAECWGVEKDVVSAITRAEQADEDIRAARPYTHSRASSTSSVTGQFQSFTLEPRSSASPIVTSPSPGPTALKHSRGFSDLQYTSRGMKDTRLPPDQDNAGSSFTTVTYDTPSQPQPPHRSGSDPAPELASPSSSPQRPVDERRRLMKSPSRPEFNPQGVPVKKRSGFFSWSGRKDEP